MSVVCRTCGSRNRDKAMFCSGCAGRLPGFMPTGPSALDAVKTSRAAPISPFDAPMSPLDAPFSRPRAASLALLPAETAAFWLRLGLSALAMSVVFIGWYLYVTRDVAEPSWWPKLNAAAAAPEAKAPPTEKDSVVVPAPASTPAPPQAAAPAPVAPAVPVAAAPAAPATPVAAAPSQSNEEKSSAAPAAPSRSAALSERTRANPPMAPRQARAPAWNRDDLGPPIAPGPGPLVGSVSAPAWLRDPGPPVVPGPGPLVSSSRATTPTFDDPGPPVVPGPGPLVSSSRAPAWAADDAGPPIAIGPGPLANPVRAPRAR